MSLLAEGRFGTHLKPSARRQAVPEESDALSAFLDERCTVDSAASVGASELWDAYVEWADASEAVGRPSRREFVTRLKQRGILQERDSRTGLMKWKGVGLMATEGLKRPESIFHKPLNETSSKKVSESGFK